MRSLSNYEKQFPEEQEAHNIPLHERRRARKQISMHRNPQTSHERKEYESTKFIHQKLFENSSKNIDPLKCSKESLRRLDSQNDENIQIVKNHQLAKLRSSKSKRKPRKKETQPLPYLNGGLRFKSHKNKNIKQNNGFNVEEIKKMQMILAIADQKDPSEIPEVTSEHADSSYDSKILLKVKKHQHPSQFSSNRKVGSDGEDRSNKSSLNDTSPNKAPKSSKILPSQVKSVIRKKMSLAIRMDENESYNNRDANNEDDEVASMVKDLLSSKHNKSKNAFSDIVQSSINAKLDSKSKHSSDDRISSLIKHDTNSQNISSDK